MKSPKQPIKKLNRPLITKPNASKSSSTNSANSIKVIIGSNQRSISNSQSSISYSETDTYSKNDKCDEIEIFELRNQLIKEMLNNDNFQIELPVTKLLNLKQHLDYYISSCLSQDQYNDARNAILLNEMVSKEIQESLDVSKIFVNHIPPTPAFLHNKNQEKSTSNSKDGKNVTRSLESLRPNFKYAKNPVLKSFDLETLSKEREIRFTEQLQLEDFEERWRGKLRNDYSHHSTNYYDLANKEKELRKAGKDKKADEIQAQLLELEEEENRNNTEAYIRDYNYAKKKLLEKYDNEVYKLLKSRDALRDKAVERSLGIVTGPIQRGPVPTLRTPFYPSKRPKLPGRPSKTAKTKTRQT